MKRLNIPVWVWLILAALFVFGGIANKGRFGMTGKHHDIFYLYSDSKTVAEGENPYARTDNMFHNKKFSTYFPLFYLSGALVIKNRSIRL